MTDAFQYNAIGIVIPWDALDCLFIHKLEALEKSIATSPGVERNIEIYIVAEEDTCYLRRWSSAGLLSWEIGEFIRKSSLEYMKLPLEGKVPKVLQFLRNFNEEMKNYIKHAVMKAGKKPTNPWKAFSCVLR